MRYAERQQMIALKRQIWAPYEPSLWDHVALWGVITVIMLLPLALLIALANQ